MEKPEVDRPNQTAPTAAELASDERLEALLDEALAAPAEDPFPPGFTARLMEGRPFAPWEVRRAAVWKAPLLVFSGLLVLSALVFVLPVLRLGPGSALALWAWATLAALTRPLAALGSVLRILPEAGEVLKGTLSPIAMGAGTLATLATGALLVRGRGRQAARGATR